MQELLFSTALVKQDKQFVFDPPEQLKQEGSQTAH